jgi:hypothetical protein
MANTVRSNISIPADLKARMDAIEEPVNWSAVASQAFEAKLAEIITRRGAKQMEDVITRLRASNRKGESEAKAAGREAGLLWASDEAEAEELERLERAWNENTNNSLGTFSTEWDGAYGPEERFVFTIRPEDDTDRDAAAQFWTTVHGEDYADFTSRDGFVQGFFEGALEVWSEVKDKL